MATLAALLGALETPGAAAHALHEARACRTLAELDASEEKTLMKRLQALLALSAHAQQDEAWGRAGRAAQLFMDQCGWHVAETHGSFLLQRALAHGEACIAVPDALPSLLPLLTLVLRDVMGREARAHPEYYRAVVAPHAPKMAATLAALAEVAVEASAAPLLGALAEHLANQATLYRPHAARLHAVCMRALFAPYASAETAMHAVSSPTIVHEATHLLSALHHTGAAQETHGKVSQAQLWSAPLTEILDAAFAAAHGVVPSSGVVPPCAALGWETTPDYAVNIPASRARVHCLLGDMSHPGVLLAYLAVPTPRPVPVPITRLVALAHTLLTLCPAPGAVPHDQLQAEAGSVPMLRRTGLRLVTHIALLFREACWRYVHAPPSLLETVCHVAETAAGTDAVRHQALRALAVVLTGGMLPNARVPGAGLAIDPASGLVSRIARLAVSACTQALLPAPVAGVKRARVFASDEVALAHRPPQDHVLNQAPAVLEHAESGLALLCGVYGALACSPMPGSRDLARTGALSVVGLAEALIDGRLLDVQRPEVLALALTAVRVLATLVVRSKGALMAFVLLRTRTVLAQGARSPVPLLRAVCEEVRATTLPLLRPRAPPVFDSVDAAALECSESDVVPLPRPAYHPAKRGAEALYEAEALLRGADPAQDGAAHVDAEPTAPTKAPAADVPRTADEPPVAVEPPVADTPLALDAPPVQAASGSAAAGGVGVEPAFAPAPAPASPASHHTAGADAPPSLPEAASDSDSDALPVLDAGSDDD